MKWQEVRGYEGLYEVSTDGEVKTCDKIERRFVRGRYIDYHRKERLLKQGNHNAGYKCVVLYREGCRKTFLVHRLVALTFIYDDSGHVDHIDGNKHNNRLANLRYCTPRENCHFHRKNKKSSSKYIGVAFNHNKYEAQILFNGKQVFIGSFDTEDEAHEKYQEALSLILKGLKPKIYRVKFTAKMKGISYNKKWGKYSINKHIDKVHYMLGSFDTEAEAEAVLIKFNKEHAS